MVDEEGENISNIRNNIFSLFALDLEKTELS